MGTAITVMEKESHTDRNSKIFNPSWDMYSCAIITLFIFIQSLSWELFPFFIDIYYHLAVMLGYNTAGGYTPFGFWEYAPVGRPHLYPPLLHIIMLFFYKIGLSKLFIARALSFIMFPLSVTSIWLFMRSLFNKRTAFFSVLAASTCYSFYYMSLITIPASLAVLSALASFLCIENNRRLAAVILLSYSFYLHALMPWVIVLSFLAYGMSARRSFFVYARTAGIALLLAAPLLVNQYLKAAYFTRIDIVQDHRAEINIFLMVFAVIGAVISARKKGKYYFPIMLFFSFAVLIPIHKYRFISAEGLYGFIPLAAVGGEYIYSRITSQKKALVFLASVIVLFAVLSPSIDVENGVFKPRIFNSTVVNTIFSVQKGEHGMARSVFFKKFYNKVTAVVKRYSAEDDVIYSNFDYFAGIIGVLADRATSNAMLSEIRPFRQFDPVRAAAIIIWLKDPDFIKDEPVLLIKKYGLKMIKDTEIAFIYKNPRTDGKRQVPRPLITNNLLFLILFISAGAIIFDLIVRRPFKS